MKKISKTEYFKKILLAYSVLCFFAMASFPRVSFADEMMGQMDSVAIAAETNEIQVPVGEEGTEEEVLNVEEVAQEQVLENTELVKNVETELTEGEQADEEAPVADVAEDDEQVVTEIIVEEGAPVEELPVPEAEVLPCPTSVNEVDFEITANEEEITTVTEDSGEASQTQDVENSTGQETQSDVSQTEGAIVEEQETVQTTLYDCDSTTVVSENDATVENNFLSTGESGENKVEAGEGAEDVVIETGDVKVYGNVLTVVNVNGVNSEVLALVENFDSLSSNLVMTMPDATATERAQGLVGEVCTSTAVYCKSLSSFVLDSTNEANVENNAAAVGNSGGNEVIAGSDVEKSSIKTGDVFAVINILNIVNVNLINSTWQVVATNIFGDVNGDLVLPSAMELNEWFSVGTSTNVAEEVAQVEKVTLDLTSENNAVIENNVVLEANSGDNGLSSGDDTENSSIDTGDAVAAGKVTTISNTVLVNTRWVMGIVNILGKWTGEAENVPAQVVVEEGPTGLSFLAIGGLSSEETSTYLESMSKSVDEKEEVVEVNTNNTTSIENNAVALATTGENNITAGSDIEDSKIESGVAKALANIFTWANGTLVNSDIYVGVINIFGDLVGKVVFGYADLSVEQKTVESNESKSEIVHTIEAKNVSGADSKNAKVEWEYDPIWFELVHSDFEYEEVDSGKVIFSLGDFPYNTSKQINLLLRQKNSGSEDAKVMFTARIYGSSPEKNFANNQSTTTWSLMNLGGSGQNGVGQDNNNQGQTTQNTNPTQNYSNYVTSPIPPQKLLVQKTHNAGSSVLPGSQVEFKITIQNNSRQKIGAVVLYDTLKGPSGIDFGEQVGEVGELEAGQSIEIVYTITLPNDSPAGTYVTTAYAKGIEIGSLSLIQSLSSTTSFHVGGLAEEVISNEDFIEVAEEQNAEEEYLPAVLSENDGNDKKPEIVASTNSIIDNNILPPLETYIEESKPQVEQAWMPVEPVTQSGYSPDQQKQMLSTIMICFLIALGYALANVSERSKVGVVDKSWIKSLANKFGIL